MGTTQSRPNHQQHPSPPIAIATTNSSTSQTTPARRQPRRQESINALSSVKATAAPPSESHASAIAHPSTSSHFGPSGSSRQRSPSTTTLDPADRQAPDDSMGNESSRPRYEPVSPSRSTTPAKLVPIPGSADNIVEHESSSIEPAAPSQDRNHIPPSQIQRPPRLPLPIEEEVYTPGSPIISTADVTSALNQESLEAGLPRISSLLSSTTADDDDVDELQPFGIDPASVKKTVPTLIEWKQPGEKVYVTGTFAGWNKKFRLQKNEPRDGLSAIIQLAPGTHHLKFLVDDEMRTADHLPTAVDFTNVLVNYIEVPAQEPPTAASKPIDIQKTRPRPFPPPGLHPPLVLPPTPTDEDADYYEDDGEFMQTTRPGQTPEDRTGVDGERERAVTNEEMRMLEKLLRNHTTGIPRYLRDLEAPEGSTSNRRIIRATPKMPSPPALPGFLGKSILNGTTPVKDDSSVLNMPNHTVLNHLATSSIKDRVVATSVTTRVQKKYLTTIMYKPVDGHY